MRTYKQGAFTPLLKAVPNLRRYLCIIGVAAAMTGLKPVYAAEKPQLASPRARS
jgi:hypothetical protein